MCLCACVCVYVSVFVPHPQVLQQRRELLEADPVCGVYGGAVEEGASHLSPLCLCVVLGLHTGHGRRMRARQGWRKEEKNTNRRKEEEKGGE